MFALAYVYRPGWLVPAPDTVVFRRGGDGQVRAQSFPDEVDVHEELARRLDPRLVRVERGKLYITAANGEAVYVPVGPSPLAGCVRYGRLYFRAVGRSGVG